MEDIVLYFILLKYIIIIFTFIIKKYFNYTKLLFYIIVKIIFIIYQ